LLDVELRKLRRPNSSNSPLTPDKPEQICVAVAEHPIANIGRSFHGGRQPAPGQERTAEGLHFAEQWTRALAVDPEFIFVTGWNEWIAQL
jgi:hypothetical protein